MHSIVPSFADNLLACDCCELDTEAVQLRNLSCKSAAKTQRDPYTWRLGLPFLPLHMAHQALLSSNTTSHLPVSI